MFFLQWQDDALKAGGILVRTAQNWGLFESPLFWTIVVILVLGGGLLAAIVWQQDHNKKN